MSVDLHAYVFIGRGWWGFTHDATGADLPPAQGPWSFFRNARIAGPQAAERTPDDARVMADLAANGVAMLQITPQILDKE